MYPAVLFQMMVELEALAANVTGVWTEGIGSGCGGCGGGGSGG